VLKREQNTQIEDERAKIADVGMGSAIVADDCQAQVFY